ncbi:MAG: tRNA (adenosine(37)-N6)-threonylcarbamoyltransferase complex dimerization subunit type 1 TsaB [Bacteroidales bacterium]
MILCLETATNICSVALCDNNGVVALKESAEGKSHASQLTVFISSLLKEAGIKPDNLEAVAVSKGPGSYTGLRIGVSTAKGIAYAASIPLIGVATTLSMFHGFKPFAENKYGVSSSDFFTPALDARRMEIYYCVLDSSGKEIKGISAEIINKDTFNNFASSSRIFLFGDGASKCREVLKGDNIIIDDDFRTSASFMLKPAYEALAKKRFEDVAYFEPFYLKDFLTTRPVKNIL